MLPDDTNVAPEDAERRDLEARLTVAEALVKFLLRAFNAFRSYSVDFTSLPEWNNTEDLDKARRLTPQRGMELTIKWLAKLEHGLTAAIRRKQFRDVNRKE